MEYTIKNFSNSELKIVIAKHDNYMSDYFFTIKKDNRYQEIIICKYLINNEIKFKIESRIKNSKIPLYIEKYILKHIVLFTEIIPKIITFKDIMHNKSAYITKYDTDRLIESSSLHYTQKANMLKFAYYAECYLKDNKGVN